MRGVSTDLDAGVLEGVELLGCLEDLQPLVQLLEQLPPRESRVSTSQEHRSFGFV